MTTTGPEQEERTALTSDEKLWIVLCHASLLIGVGLLLPLVVYLVKKDSSPLVADHAREALNFHLSLLIYSMGCMVLVFVVVGFFLMLALSVGSIVLAIIATIKSSDGTFYRYPLTLRLVT